MYIIKNIWKVLTAKEKKQFTFLTLLDIVISVADILFLTLLLWMVQFYVQPKSGAHLFFFSEAFIEKNMTLGMALFFMVFAIKNLFAILITRRQFRFVGDVAVRISALNLTYVQQAAFTQYTDDDSSVQVRKIAFQPFEFCQYLLSGVQQIITQTFLVGGTLTAILLFNAKIFLLLLIILLPPVAVVFFFIKRKFNKIRVGIRSANERSFQYLMDALKGYVEANIYHRNAFFSKRFIAYRQQFSKYLFQSLSIQVMPPRIIEAFAIMGLFLLILLAQWTGNHKDSLLMIGAFMAAAYKMIPGLVKLINTTGQMKAYAFSLEELVLEQKTWQVTAPAHKVIEIESIELKDVCFSYSQIPIIDHFDLCIKPGDFIGIMAPSGRGKTTLFHLMLGFLTPTSGGILVNGRSAKGDELKKIWPSVSYVRQQSFIINDTVAKNITLDEHADETRLQQAINISGVGHFLNDGQSAEKMVSENGKNISGGQQQRIGLARALYKDADLFLLDEAFNELDEHSEHLILEHFQKLSLQGKMVIMITHRKKSLQFCNKIISLKEEYA